jgi:hypothetical protein
MEPVEVIDIKHMKMYFCRVHLLSALQQDKREMKSQEVGENYIMRSFITCTLLQV